MVAPLVGASAVMRERSLETLDLLTLAGLSTGKLVGAFVVAYGLVLAGFSGSVIPVVGLIREIGGFDTFGLVAFATGIVATVAWGLACGILCGVFSQTTAGALVGGLGISTIFAVAIPELWMSSRTPYPPGLELVLRVGPFVWQWCHLSLALATGASVGTPWVELGRMLMGSAIGTGMLLFGRSPAPPGPGRRHPDLLRAGAAGAHRVPSSSGGGAGARWGTTRWRGGNRGSRGRAGGRSPPGPPPSASSGSSSRRRSWSDPWPPRGS